MNHIDLFSGIGGFALAASRVWPDHHPILFCEIEPFCQAVLNKHWPNTTIHADIATLDARPFLGQVDLLTGGFPCQPYSVAGKRRGTKDDRALWPEMLRIIEECRPGWIVAENVPGIISLDLPLLLLGLESAGYSHGTITLPAAGIGAPHIRNRVWVVASSSDVDSERCEEACGVGSSERPSPELGRGDQPHDLPHTDSQRREEHLAATFAIKSKEPHRRPVERWREGWLSEPGILRVVDGVSTRMDRRRIAALGNAIVPQVAAELFMMIRQIEEGS